MATTTMFIDGQAIAKTMVVECKVSNMKKVGIRLRLGVLLLKLAEKIGGFKIDTTIVPPPINGLIK